MIRRARYLVAAAGSAAILAGVMTLAGATAAMAQAPLPSCANGVRCTNNSGNVYTNTFSHGLAGYYGADDLGTHYRYVQTIVTATPGLKNLNGFGPADPNREGGVGVSLCDVSSGKAAQVSLQYTVANGYELKWAVGSFGPSGSFAKDPCIQTGFLHPQFFHGFGTIKGVNPGDKILLAIYYSTPNGPLFHQFSFGAIDITQGIVRQAWSGGKFNLSLTEFGIGAFSAHNFIQGGAINPLDTFAANAVTCYSCPGAVPITSVQPVNPFLAGGLYEAQFTNTSGQVQMSPLDSLTPTSFNMWSGSTGGQ